MTRGRALSLALFASALCACSILVEPSANRIRCEVAGAVDPCPVGQRCLDGLCTSVPDGGIDCQEREIGCNQIDDDCDGETDEGSDIDGDGFTWCSSEPSLRDCRDDNGAIHPAGPDTPAPPDPPCDSADNDCDGMITECPVGQSCDPEGACRVPDCTFAFECPTGRRCNPELTPAACEEVAVDCTVSGCGTELVCDPYTRACAAPLPLGSACRADVQCAGGAICAPRAALGLAAEHVGGDSLCTRPCCTDSDCGSSARCWASGTGARGCVPNEILSLGPNGLPADAGCARAADCAEDCALRNSPAYQSSSRRTFTCGAAIGSETAFCSASSECASGLCVQYCWSTFYCEGGCSAPCGSTADCADIERCGWVDLGGAFAQACIYGVDGSGTGGAPCGSDADCRDEACLAGSTGRYCGDVCCSDTACGGGSRCRPVAYHGRWEMLCVRE